jgi:endonuclease/exonuclease/phosphatase family metal-dependent hydrolase
MRLSSLACTVLLLAACGGGSSNPDARPSSDAPPQIDSMLPSGDASMAMIPEDLPSPLPSGPIDLTAVTFNTGLIAVVKGPEERMALQLPALKALDADVLCLQEVFTGYTNGPMMAAALADTYPYAYWSWTGQYVQRNGVLIVSKHPLYRGRELYYAMGNEGPSVDRIALGVTMVDSANAWHADVICTHMHAGLKAVDLPKKLSEATELNAWAATEGYTTGPTLLLGDFNAGPVPPSADVCECDDLGDTDPLTCKKCDAGDLATWNKLGEVFTDPFPEDADFFTSGREQFLQLAVVPGLFPDEPTQRIDHCMFRDIAPAVFVTGNTVMDAPQSISVGGETLEYLSDHYGVMCSFAE